MCLYSRAVSTPCSHPPLHICVSILQVAYCLASVVRSVAPHMVAQLSLPLTAKEAASPVLMQSSSSKNSEAGGTPLSKSSRNLRSKSEDTGPAPVMLRKLLWEMFAVWAVEGLNSGGEGL